MGLKRVLLLAGEESGAIYAREIGDRLRAIYPEVEIRGYGDYGFSVQDMAVMGLWAVLAKLGYFLRLKRVMERAIDEWRPDSIVTIDYPGLNLKLAAYAKARGVRAVHVVCPQVWAWKRGRIPKIEAALDRLGCFLPFEPKLFKPGFAEFVGHPLLKVVRKERFERGDERMVALLPGSRKSEIAKILPTLLEVAAKLKEVKVVIPAANERAERQIRSLLALRPELAGKVVVQLGGARALLLKAECAAVASGTATLEAAIARCPTVLVYRLSTVLAWFVRGFVRGTRYAGLVNVIWDRSRPDFDEQALRPVASGSEVNPDFPMPELIQESFTAERTLGFLQGWLDNPEKHAAAVAKLDAAVGLLETATDPLERIVSLIDVV